MVFFLLVHPTGLVDPRDPDCKVKWLAAEALRGTGALLLDGNGKRFCNELGHRDYVSGEMGKNKVSLWCYVFCSVYVFLLSLERVHSVSF